MNRHFAAVAFVIALIALTLAAFRNNFIHPKTPPERETTTLKQVMGEAAKKLLEEKVLHKAPPPPPAAAAGSNEAFRQPLHPYQMIYTGLGLMAVALGIFSWTQKQHVRLAGAAAAIGIVVVCWEWTVWGVCVAVAIWILGNL